MTIDEAIKVNEENKMLFDVRGDVLAAESTQLGIEALYRLKRDRVRGYIRQNDSLPGETS